MGTCLPTSRLVVEDATTSATELAAGRGEKEARGILAGDLENEVRGWLEPYIMLSRYWRAFSKMPPPPQLRALLERVFSGRGLYLYVH